MERNTAIGAADEEQLTTSLQRWSEDYSRLAHCTLLVPKYAGTNAAHALKWLVTLLSEHLDMPDFALQPSAFVSLAARSSMFLLFFCSGPCAWPP